MQNKRKIHFLDSTNIILSVKNAFTKTTYKYCKESVEKRESLTYVLASIQLKLFLWGRGLTPSLPLIPMSNFSFTHLYFKMCLERFLNDPTTPLRASFTVPPPPRALHPPCLPPQKILIIHQ